MRAADMRACAADSGLGFNGTMPQDESLLQQLETLCTAAEVPGSHAAGDPNLQCSCNVRETFLLPAAVSQVFSRIITQYRSCLPHQAWFSVCLHFAKLMMTVRGVKSKGAQASDAADAPPQVR